MKKSLLNTCLIISLASFSSTHARSNNGYTTGANLYTGSSSRGWYGGGVAYQLAEWRKKEDVAEKTDNTTGQSPISAQSDATKPANATAAVDNTVEQSLTADMTTSTQRGATTGNKEGINNVEIPRNE